MGSIVRFTLYLSCLLYALTACENTSVKPHGPTDAITSEQPEQQAKELLARAEKAGAVERYDLMLQAAEILARSGDTPWARSILNELPASATPGLGDTLTLQIRRRLVESHIKAADGNYPLAYDYLNDEFVNDSLDGIPLETAQSILRLKAQLLFDMGYYSTSVEQRVKLGDILTSGSADSQENEELIWQTLMEIPLDELQKLSEQADSRELKGWYLLATLIQDNQTNLREQLAQLDGWIAQWPDHPASLNLPADLRLLRQLLEEKAQQIALLLPLSGKLGNAGVAIRDGFMAAFYATAEGEPDMPVLRFYDTNNNDVNNLYDQAVAEGAELVIGPLSKDSILELSLRLSMPVPTLALNVIDNPLSAVPNLYQFGLGVEDEARVAAERAWRDGHRRALIIAPNSTWGDRSVDSFVMRWQALGGELARDYRFEDNNDYVKVIQHALQLDSSHVRSREIRGLVGHIEFEPRRRQDIDMIFLAAQAAQARQVKPTLAFHYAADIPVYATSQVYTGAPNPKLDQDMNGIRFSTLPWLFNKNLEEKQSITRHTENNASLQPLYAMGVDSFHLYPRLRQLETIKKSHFYGQTGKLNLNEDKQFVRQQVWAEFEKGRAKRLSDAN